MSFFRRVFQEPAVVQTATFFNRVFIEADDEEYREHPMDLPERMFLRSVRSGASLPGAEALTKFKAKKPEFKDLERRGFIKHHAVLRSKRADDLEATKKAEADRRKAEAAAQKGKKGKKKKKDKGPRQEHPGYEGRKVVVHYWEHPETGERTKAKIVSPSPWRSRL